jgi:hypothetical protein
VEAGGRVVGLRKQPGPMLVSVLARYHVMSHVVVTEPRIVNWMPGRSIGSSRTRRGITMIGIDASRRLHTQHVVRHHGPAEAL